MGVPWISSQQRNKRGIADFSGGVNTGSPPFYIQDSQSIDEYGWDTDEHPSLKTRKGRTPYGALTVGITRLLTNFGNTHLVRAIGTALSYNSSGTTWTAIAGTFADTDWDATNFDVSGPVLILTNGTDNVKYWNGSTLADLNAVDAPKGKYITADNRRVYIAVGDTISFCAFQDATNWTTALNAGTVQYYTSNGGDVTALKCFEGNVWAFKKDAFCLIFHTGDSRATHRLVEISNDIGCIAYKTVQEVGSFLFWLGQKDVYIGAGGNAAPIGEPIRSFLDSINTTYIDKCFGGTDGIRYYLGLVTGANTEPDTLLVYDPRRKREKWHVQSQITDLRYSATLNNVWYNGGSTGQTYKMNDGTTDNGTAIPFMYETKDYDEGFPEAEKEYFELHLQITAPTGTTMTVQASVDQGTTYTSVGDPITVSSVAQNVNIIIPLDTVPLGNWIRFKISGSGQINIFRIERYFNVLPVQH